MSSVTEFNSPPTRRSARLANNPPRSMTSPGMRTRRPRASPIAEIKPYDYTEDEAKKDVKVEPTEITDMVTPIALPPASEKEAEVGQPSLMADYTGNVQLEPRTSRILQPTVLWAFLGALCWGLLSIYVSALVLPVFEGLKNLSLSPEGVVLGLSQIGVLCFALAFDWWKKAFVISTMFVLAPALWLQFRDLDFEPTITLMHIISSVYFHAVQDVRNPALVHSTNETAAFLDYFWASLDIVSVFIYIADIQSQQIKALVYLVFVYALLALLFKDRREKLQLLFLVIFVGGLSVVIGRYSITREWPSFDWRLFLPALGLLAYAAYNFLVLQDRSPHHYWLHHGLWHLAGNASFLLFLYLRTTDTKSSSS